MTTTPTRARASRSAAHSFRRISSLEGTASGNASVDDDRARIEGIDEGR